MMLGGQVKKGGVFSVRDNPTRDCVQAAECEEAQAGVPAAGKGGWSRGQWRSPVLWWKRLVPSAGAGDQYVVVGDLSL